MSQFPDERAEELKELFFESASELLQSLNEETLKLEKQPGDLEAVRTIRRIVHTLKGRLGRGWLCRTQRTGARTRRCIGSGSGRSAHRPRGSSFRRSGYIQRDAELLSRRNQAALGGTGAENDSQNGARSEDPETAPTERPGSLCA